MLCQGPDDRAINPKSITRRVSDYYEETKQPNGESRNGARFRARVKTDRIPEKKDIWPAISDIAASGNSAMPIECYSLDDPSKRILPPDTIDFDRASKAEKQEFFDKLHEFINTDKLFYGCGHAWEAEGSFSVAEKLDRHTGKLLSLGNLSLRFAFPCIEEELDAIYSFIRKFALLIHAEVPNSYGALELGNQLEENFEWVYSIENLEARRKNRYEHLKNNYSYMGSFNILTEDMAKRITAVTNDEIICTPLAVGGMSVEPADFDKKFRLSTLSAVRNALDPVLARGSSEHIGQVLRPCVLLPVPRKDLVEKELYWRLTPVISNL